MIRIISLVPSITELLFALGLGPHVVGRTGFCTHPLKGVSDVPKVGGTKDLNLERIRALLPTHVIVNVDENRLEDVAALRLTGAEIVVMLHPDYQYDATKIPALIAPIAEGRADWRAIRPLIEWLADYVGPAQDPGRGE